MALQSKPEPTVSSAILASYIQAAIKLGVSKDDIETASGVKLAAMADPDGRLPMGAYLAISDTLRTQLGPAFGLRVVETMTDTRVTVMAYLLANSATLGDAFKRISRYRGIVTESEKPELVVNGKVATFGCRHPKALAMIGGAWIESTLGFWLLRARHFTGVDWDPMEVQLQGSATEPEVYARIFRSPVTNHCECSQLVFASELLDLPIKNPDARLLHYLTPIADEIIRNLPGGQSIQHQVQEKILALLEHGDCSMEKIADQLHMSVRTLQRRLEEGGTTFANVLENTRHIAAVEYLKDPRIAITEVVYLLGFSEPSTFYRAFKRWTDQTPAQFRKSLTA
ncbi:MAG: AraC family transcriptional regulator [Gammaproteobacteria bacterium]|nr:AraC family transcriptional regulator [Gammaproteobacteria bacterium]